MPIATSSATTKKEIEAMSEKIKKTRLNFSDIMIPIAVIVILVILGIFVFVPMIKASISSQAEYAEILKKEEQLKQLEKTLNGMDEGILQSDLINARKVIPNTLKVSSFIYYIDNLASQKELTSAEISAGDVKINTEEEVNDGKYTFGVSGPLAYKGTFNNVMSFLDSLNSASPYIISLQNLVLSQRNDLWEVTLSVTGYYVPQMSTVVDLYSPFTPYTQYQNIVKMFETKASQLD